MDAGELDFCVGSTYFGERELFLLFLHTRIEGEREAEITSCDSASVLCIIICQLHWDQSKVKKVLHILISTFRHTKLLAGEHIEDLSHSWLLRSYDYSIP